MKFRLRTLFILVTLAAILVSGWVARKRLAQRIAQRRLTFMELEETIKRLDEPLIDMVCELPAVRTELERANPVDPKSAIGQSITGQGLFFGQYQFAREIELSWQTPQGDWETGVHLELKSMLDESGREPHVIQIWHDDSELNRQVANWLQKRLKQPAKLRFEVLEQKPE